MLVVSVGNEKSNWSGLHRYLIDIPEIAIPSDPQLKKVARNRNNFESRSIGEALSKPLVDEKWATALNPSYAIVTAKDLGLKGSSRPRWEASGDYGYKWGSAIHELLEISLKAPNANQRASALRLANEYSLGSDRVDELMSTVQSVTQSEIWKRSQAASRCFSELPFETSSRDNTGKLTIIRGVIDIIFEEPTGWVIVDYKTDDISEGELPSAIDYYRGQIEKYADQWRDTTGFQTSELGLYFTRIDRYVKVT